MTAVVIRAPSVEAVTVRPFPGLPVKVTPAADEPVRVRGTAMLPGPAGIGIADITSEAGGDGTVVFVFTMTDGNVHRVSFTGGKAPAPEPDRLDLSGAAIAGATATARLDAWLALAGAGAGRATASGQLALQTILNGHAVGEASASGSLALQLLLAGSAEARSSATAAVSMTLNLAGAAVAGAQASGFLSLGSQLDLQGAAKAGATATGALLLQLPLAGHATGRASASGSLSTALDLSGSATARGTATGAPSMSLALAGAATGQASATGAISIEAAAAGYDPDAQAYFNAMTVQPAATRKGHLDTLVKGLKADGLWSKLIGYQLWASHDDQAGRVDLKAPSRVAQKINTPIFTVDRGFSGDGIGAYLDTMIADDPGRMNSFSFGGHINAATGTSAGLLWWNSNAVRVFAASGARLRSTNDATLAGSGPVGFSAGDRAASATQESYFNGQLVQSRSAASSGTPSTSSTLTSHRSSSAAFSEGRIAAVFAASSLTADEHSKLYARTNTFLSAIGAV